MKKYFFLIVFNLLTIFSYSQVTLSGYIEEDGSGERLPYSNVYISEIEVGSSANENGFFTIIGDIKSGMTLKASYVGYKTISIILTNEIIDNNLEISLTPLTSTLNEVVVSTESSKFLQASTEISKHKLSVQQLSLMPSIGEVDIFRSLQLLPGVSATNENNSGLYIRGGEPHENLVLLDGIKVYNVDHFFGFFSAFNANAIKSVELYKGAFPSKYGGRLSSVIDLAGKVGSFNEIKGTANINLLSASGSIEVPFLKKFSFFAAGRRSFTDILQTSFFDKIFDQFDPNDDIENLDPWVPKFNFYDFNAKISYKPTKDDLITFSFYRGQDDLKETSDTKRYQYPNFGGIDRIEINGDLDRISRWGNSGYSFKWSRQWNPKFYNSFNVSFSEFYNYLDDSYFVQAIISDIDSVIFDFSTILDQDNTVQDFTARYDGELISGKNNKFEFGLEFTNSNVDYLFLRDDTTTIIDTRQVSDLFSSYISYDLKSVKNLNLKVGLRASRYELTNKNYFSPRFQLDYKIFKNIKIKLGYGIHNQFVKQIIGENVTSRSRDFWQLSDDDDINVGESTHYIAGLSYENNSWLFDTEFFYKDIKNITEFSLRFQNTNLNSLFFNGSGTVKGFETLLQKKADKYTGWVSYTYLDTENIFPLLNDGNPFPAPNTQKNEFKIFNNYELNGWNFSINFIYGSGKAFTEPSYNYNITLLDDSNLNFIGVGPKNGSLLPDYHRLDLSIHHIFNINNTTKGDVGLSVFNLYNNLNVWYYEYSFDQRPYVRQTKSYLGIVPNISFKLTF
ncbi:MAG: TonB-dependent receptor [Cytophagales bacterium]|nr:TonB-dependent receptor [Cytophagales bacterium]